MSNELNAKEIIGQELALVDINDVRIAKMKEEYMVLVITDLNNAKQFDAVHQARMEVKAARITVQKVSKAKRENAVKFQKDCIEEEKRLIGLLEPVETHLQFEEDKVEKEKARIKAEAEAKEAARIQKRVDLICSYGPNFNGTEYIVYGLMIPVAIVKMATDEDFDNFMVRVMDAKDAEDERIKAEEEAKKAEAERLAKIAAEQEAERLRLEDIQKEQEAAAAKMKAEQEAYAERIRKEQAALLAKQAEEEAKIQAEKYALEKEKQRLIDEEAARLAKIEADKKAAEAEKKRLEELEQAKKDAAAKALRDAEAKRLAEEGERLAKIERDRIAAEKKAARAPDKVKVQAWINSFNQDNNPLPVCKHPEAQAIVTAAFQTIEEALQKAEKQVEEL